MRLTTFNDNRLAILDDARLQDVTSWAFANCPPRIADPLIAFICAREHSGAALVGAWLPANGARLGAPIRQPGKIIAAAANYLRHTQEMNPGQAKPGDIREKGFFLKAPSSIIGPNETILLPFKDRRTDHEAELAVVIGRTGKNIPPSQALDYVFGYTCLLDITVRGKEDRGLRKSFDTFTPIGPWITTKDEIPDPNKLKISCRVNGEERQNDTTASMIMPVPELIAWISSVMTLHPGDIIATGTPAGVGPLQPGDRIEVAIERLGAFSVDVKTL
jgi:2-keto-4-pentenoate hydratase/2-oxohepta-3-ene-1,7-dioic acid hydratase in catechol pathway